MSLTNFTLKTLNFARNVALDIKQLRNWVGNLTGLTTNHKTDLVGAINEVNGKTADIKIGGRNLLKSDWTSSVQLLQGETYVLSFRIKSPSSLGYKFVHLWRIGQTWGSDAFTTFNIQNSTDVISISFVCPITDFYYFVLESQDWNYEYAQLPTLQIGNKATEWHPAPEDKANINGSNTTGGTWNIGVIYSSILASLSGNGQVYNANANGRLILGNPQLVDLTLETSDINGLKVYVPNYGIGQVWHAYNFDPTLKADVTYVDAKIAAIPVHNGQLNVNTTADLVGGYTYLPSGNVTTTLGLATHVLNAIADGQTAFGWGNHATAGYASVNYVNQQIQQISLTPGPQGTNGVNGLDAVISGATATVSNTVGTPSVIVTTGGTPQNRTFQFAFQNLKGDPGAPGSGSGGITNISTDDPNMGGPTSSNIPINFTSHVAYGKPETWIQDGEVGNGQIQVTSGDYVRFHHSFDNVATMVDGTGKQIDIDIDGLRKHIYNAIFTPSGSGIGGTVTFGDGLYTGDQINVTVPRGQQITLLPLAGTNLISSFGQELQTHANLIWDAVMDSWVLVGYD